MQDFFFVTKKIKNKKIFKWRIDNCSLRTQFHRGKRYQVCNAVWSILKIECQFHPRLFVFLSSCSLRIMTCIFSRMNIFSFFFLVKRRNYINQNITSSSVHNLLKETPIQSSSKALAKSIGRLENKMYSSSWSAPSLAIRSAHRLAWR